MLEALALRFASQTKYPISNVLAALRAAWFGQPPKKITAPAALRAGPHLARQDTRSMRCPTTNQNTHQGDYNERKRLNEERLVPRVGVLEPGNESEANAT
jgi:hypothetical protein